MHRSIVFVVLAACQFSFTAGPLEEPKEPAREMKIADAAGRPTGLVGNAPGAFWIWQEEDGRLWHVRTTTRSEKHRFTGLVNGDEGGPITDLVLTRVDLDDKMRGVKKGIQFDFETAGHEDGFDFRVDGQHCVRFYLKLDGQADPASIVVGAANAHPPHSHFKLCP